MSLSAEELQQHCAAIIALQKLSHKIVILCEGNINDIKGRVHLYRRLEIFPDANFYKACIPEWWTEKRPTFIPCGDRTDVLNTYFELKKLNFSEGKLFAIIDLDLQPAKFLENYPIENTEQLFNALYQENKPHTNNIKQNPIFITGLIYKEAYFFAPDLKETFENYPLNILFDEFPFEFNAVYEKMVKSLDADNNLKQNFSIAQQRIAYLTQLDLTNISILQSSWQTIFNSAETDEKTALIYALLSIHQVKEYWKLIKCSSDAIAEARFKEQLTLAIGNFYAKQPPDSPHHLPSFFNALSAIT
jgi:hypothetical protein